MKIIYNKYIPFKGFIAINLLGIVFARKEYSPLREVTLNHEKIHTQQMRELLYVGFYIWYIVEWLVRLLLNYKTAYRKISFEQEAYEFQNIKDYSKNRIPYTWLKYFFFKL